MVIDKVQGQEDRARYLAYDIIKFENQEVGKMPFYPVRMSCIENEIIKPRTILMEKQYLNKDHEPFSIRKKDFWDIRQAANLLGEKFAKTLSHEPDGLIFQPSKEVSFNESSLKVKTIFFYVNKLYEIFYVPWEPFGSYKISLLLIYIQYARLVLNDSFTYLLNFYSTIYVIFYYTSFIFIFPCLFR